MWYKETIYDLNSILFTVKRKNIFRLSVSVIKRYGNPKGQTRMDNPETYKCIQQWLQDTERRQTKHITQHRKLKTRTTRTPSKIRIIFQSILK